MRLVKQFHQRGHEPLLNPIDVAGSRANRHDADDGRTKLLENGVHRLTDLVLFFPLGFLPVIRRAPLHAGREQVDVGEHDQHRRLAQLRLLVEKLQQLTEKIDVSLAARVACVEHENHQVRMSGRVLGKARLIQARSPAAVAWRIEQLQSARHLRRMNLVTIYPRCCNTDLSGCLLLAQKAVHQA